MPVLPAPLADRLADTLARHLPGLQAAYVFGSVAQRTATAASDVDVAVLVDGPPVAPPALHALRDACARALDRDVDLVDLRAVSTDLQAEVVARGVVLLDTAPTARLAFEAYVLAALDGLNEERAGIVAAIRSRGRVYA